MNNILLSAALSSLLLLGACKKENNYVANTTATLNVINGIIQKDVLLKMEGSINNSGANNSNSRQNRISYGASLFFYSQAKNTLIDFLNRTDSISLVQKNFDLTKGGIYTLLLAGIAPDIDAVLIDDSKMPYVNLSKTPSVDDSVINIRFINLVPDMHAVNVRVQGSSSNEVWDLAYKGISSWKSYPAKSGNASYVFEFV